jgi:uncharacterized membrane protein
MPPLVAAAIGYGAGAIAVSAGATVGAAVVVGAGTAILAHESGAADWVFDNIVEPIGEGIQDVLTSDVGRGLLKAAAAITPGMQWAIPLIDAAGALAEGGNIGDALKAAAVSYVGGKLGSAIGEYAGQVAVEATGSQVVGQIVGGGAGRATVALVMGQDPVEAFLQGGLSAGLSAAAGWIEQQGIESGAGQTWSNLPDAAQNVITASLSAALSGEDITEELIWNAVLSSEVVSKTVSGFLENNTGLNDGQIAALTMGIQRTAAVAFSGGDVSQEILNQIDNYANNAFTEWFDNTEAGIAVNTTMDKITGDYQRVAAQTEAMDAKGAEYNEAFAAYEATVTAINEGVAKSTELQTAYERALQNFQANESQENADALSAALDAYNEHNTAFNERYENTLKPNLDYYEGRIPEIEAEFAELSDEYGALVADLTITTEQLGDELTPLYGELDRTFVQFMNPDFDEEVYRQVAGLDADEDAYLHWLTTGKEQGLPTNAADAKQAYNTKFTQILQTTLERNGLTLGDISKTQFDAFVAGISEQYPDYKSIDMAPQYEIADQFAEDYALFLRMQQASRDEAADIQTVLDDWAYLQGNEEEQAELRAQAGAIQDIIDSYQIAKDDPPTTPAAEGEIETLQTLFAAYDYAKANDLSFFGDITPEIVELLALVGVDDALVGEPLTDSDLTALRYRLSQLTGGVITDTMTRALSAAGVDGFMEGESLIDSDIATLQGSLDRLDAGVITPEIAELLRNVVGIDDFFVGENLSPDDIDALQNRVIALTQVADLNDVTFEDAGVSDVNIGSGIARATYDPESGLWDWDEIGLSTGFWSPELGRMVRQFEYYKSEGEPTGDFIQGEGLPPGVGITPGLTLTDEKVYYYQDAITGEWITKPAADGVSISFGTGSAYQFDTPLQGVLETTGVGQTLADLRETAPVAFIEETAKLSADGAAAIAGIVGDAVVDFSRNVVEYADNSDTAVGDGFLNGAGLVLEAGGELLETFNNMLLLANINPASTPLGAFARDMVELGGDTKTVEWQEAVTRMNDRMSEGEGWGKVAAVWGGFQEAPVQFVAEIIGKEILQEIPILLASGGTGNITKRLLSEAGEQTAQVIAQRAALGTGAALDLAESFGGAAGSAYDSAYATALQSGMSETEAESYARDLAVSAGMIGATTTLISMGVMDGNAFEKAIFARDDSGVTAQAFDWLTQRVAEGAEVSWKEGVQESIEEGLPTLFSETVLTQLDPGRDVLGAVAQAATLGAIAGSGTAGGIYTGDAIADALIRMNPQVRTAIVNGGSDPEGVKQALADLGIDDALVEAGVDPTLVQNNLLSVVNSDYHSTGDISRAFSAHPDFVVGNADILNGVLNSVGQDVTTYVNTYVDQRYVDIDEVKAAAAAEGVTLTDEQAAAMVTQTTDPEATQGVLYSIQQTYDPQAVTEQEARDAFAAQGFNPSDEQVQQFVAEGDETTLLDELSQYVDANQVTEAEARQYFADIGYDPTDEEVAQFVGQQAEDEAQQAVADYVDPRTVDAEEVLAAYQTLGLTRPTDADIQELVGQYMETELAGRAEEYLPTARYNAILAAIDNFTGEVGVSDEVQAALDVVKADIMESFGELGQEVVAIDEATQNLEAIIGSIASGEEEASGLYAYIDDAIATLTAAGLTSDEVDAAISDIVGAPATTDADGNEVAATGIYATLAELGTTVDNLSDLSTEDIKGIVADAVGDLNNLSTEDVRAIVTNALSGFENLSEEDVQTVVGDIIGAPATTDADGNEVAATGIYATIEGAVGDLNNLSAADVQGIVSEALSGLEDSIGIDVQGVVDDIVGAPATTDADGNEVAATGIYATIEDAVGNLNNLSTEDVQGIVSDALSGFDTLSEEDVTSIVDGIVSDLNNLGTTDVETIVADALSGLENLSTADVQAVVGDIVGTPATEGVESTGVYAVIDNLNNLSETDVDSIVNAIVGTPATEDAEATGLYATIGDLNNISEEDVTAIVTDALSGLESLSADDVASVVNGIIGAPATTDADGNEVAATGLYDYIDDGLSSVQKSVLDTLSEYETAGIARDDALELAISDVATDLGVTEENILNRIGTAATEDTQATGIYAALESNTADILDILGTPATEDAAGTGIYGYIDTAIGAIGEDVTSLIDTVGTPSIADDPTTEGVDESQAATGIFADLESLQDSGLTRDQAIEQLASDLGVAQSELASAIGDVEATLQGDITELGELIGTPAIADDPTTEGVDESQAATGVFADLEALQDSGLTRDQAIEQLASDLGVAQAELESAIANIDVTEQITDVLGTTLGTPSIADDPTTEGVDESQAATGIFAELEALQESGLTRDQAISELAAATGTNFDTLNDALLSTQEDLTAQIGDLQLDTQAELDAIAELIGKPARDVTQVDIDFVADLIAQQEAIAELTAEQLQYDVNQDNVVDQADYDLLLQAMEDPTFQFEGDTVFGPATGLYAQQEQDLQTILDTIEASTQAQIDAQTQTQTELSTQLQTQLQTQSEEQRRRDFGDYLLRQDDLYGQRVDVKTPDPMRINYMYDWQSIFATPQQASLFPSPYAEGGQVEDTTDKLLRILGETR